MWGWSSQCLPVGGERCSPLLSASLQQLPSTLLEGAATCDVLPVSFALHRMADMDEALHDEPFLRSRTSPASLASLHSWENLRTLQRRSDKGRRHLMVSLVFLFVVLDASKSFAVSSAAVHGHMCAPLVICTKNSLSIGFGMLLAAHVDGERGLRQCLDFGRSIKVFPIAACFCAAQIFSLQALRAFDAGSLKVLAQLNIPATAFMSWLVLGRRYSAGQWFAICLLFVASIAFLQVRMLFFQPRHDVDPGLAQPDKVLAMLYFLSAIALSCGASIFAERFLKTRYEIPFYIQKTNLMFGELLGALLMIRWDTQGGCSWEQIQDWHQLPVILIWVAHGWTAGVLVKRCSVLAKNVSHILSTLVIYFLPLLFVPGTPHSWPVTLSGSLVLAAVLVFATVPQYVTSELGRHAKGKGPTHTEPPGVQLAANGGGGARIGGLARSNSEASLQQPSVAAAVAARRQGVLQQHATPLSPHGCRTPPAPNAGDPYHPPLSTLPHALKASTEPTTPLRSLLAGGGGGGAESDYSTHSHTHPSSTGAPAHSAGVLLLAFVLLDATKPLLMNWSQQHKAPQERFHHSAFVLTQTAVSLAIGLVLAARPTLSLFQMRIELHPDWRGRLSRCTKPRSVLQRLPVSFCLCLSKLFLLMALERLDAGTVRVFSQSSLPLVCVSTALFFSRRYSLHQWCSMVAVSLALVTFYHVKNEVQVNRGAQLSRAGVSIMGLVLIFGSILFNCLGALLVEKFLKGRRAPLHEQKAQLLLGEVLVNAVLVICTPGLVADMWHRGIFAGWDRRALICIMVWIPAGWTTTMVVKRCSNVLKTVAQATSSVLTYVFSVFPLTLVGPPLTPEPLSCPVVLLAITVMLSALTFGTDCGHSSSKAGKTNRRPAIVGTTTGDKGSSHIEQWVVDGAYKHLQFRPNVPPMPKLSSP
mmetsp:Transcript_27132/g.90172  ORF Transcript_27132/g.90172 Transcript_27132/m.90172 type:complete len:925 (-) Transcript_27132:332-3106(-)